MVAITEIDAHPPSAAAGKTSASEALERQHSRRARYDGAAGSRNSPAPPLAVKASRSSHWEPKDLRLGDTVFLSHSGADKEFVTRLYEDLLKRDYVAFLDQKSLPKATTVTMKNISQTATECRLAVFVLSQHFFTRNKNPMLELAACVDSERTLLPLFYKLTVGEFKDKERQKGWFDIWEEWEAKDSQSHVEDALKVNISKWKTALKIIGDQNGVEFDKPEIKSEEMYRESIVDCIFKLVPPDIRWDDSKVQGKERLCKEVDLMYSNFPVSDATPKTCARILGLYAVGGMGKTTLCTALLNFYSSEFRMRVCYIEFESGAAPSKEKVLQLIKKVLRVLTNALPEIIDRVTDVAQGWYVLKKHIGDNKVFLAVDNVGMESWEEASLFLEGGFQNESKVVVMGRSLDVLQNVLKKYGGISGIEMVPTLTEEEAVEVFVQKVNHPSELSQEEIRRVFRDCVNLCKFQEEIRRVFRDCVNLCKFQGAFHPLALVGLASALGEEEPKDWNRIVKDWESKGTKALPKDRPFEVLRMSYDGLREEEKQIFMDIALFLPANVKGDDEVLKWLGFLHGEQETAESIRVLRKRSLLLSGSFRIHDLYKEMARRLAAKKAKGKSVFMEGERIGREELPLEFTIERLGLACCEYDEVLDVSAYPQLRVLKLLRNKGLRKIKIGRENRRLKSLEVESEDEGLTVAVEGLENCSRSLGCLYFHNCVPKGPTSNWFGWSTDPLGCLEALRWVEVRANANNIGLPNLQGCKNLESFVVCCNHAGRRAGRSYDLSRRSWLCGQVMRAWRRKSLCLPDSSTLRELSLQGIEGLQTFQGLGSLSSLEKLHIKGCTDLERVDGLENLRSLRRLWVFDCDKLQKIYEGVARLQDDEAARNLSALRRLHVSRCGDLVEIHGLDHIREVWIRNCNRARLCFHNPVVGRSMGVEDLSFDGVLLPSNVDAGVSAPELTTLKRRRSDGSEQLWVLERLADECLPDLEHFAVPESGIFALELLRLFYSRPRVSSITQNAFVDGIRHQFSPKIENPISTEYWNLICSILLESHNNPAWLVIAAILFQWRADLLVMGVILYFTCRYRKC